MTKWRSGNTYSENAELEYLGYGFAFYYILLTINRKNKYICILFLIIYYLFYGFDIKFYLIITDIILNNKIKGTDKLCIKIIIKQLYFIIIYIFIFL